MFSTLRGELRRHSGDSSWMIWTFVALTIVAVVVGALALTTNLFSGSAPISLEQTPTIDTVPEIGVNPPAQTKPENTSPSAPVIPLVETGFQNLGLDPYVGEGILSSIDWLIPTKDTLYAINSFNFTTWRFKTGTWEKLGRTKYNGSNFQIGNIVFPTYGPYAGVYIPSHEFRYKHASEIRIVLKNILGEEVYNRGRVVQDGLGIAFTNPSGTFESWVVVSIAHDPAYPEVIAVLVWQAEETGRHDVSPTPHLYLSVDNQQTWIEGDTQGVERFGLMHPFRSLAVHQNEDGSIHLYLSGGKGVWHARIAP